MIWGVLGWVLGLRCVIGRFWGDVGLLMFWTWGFSILGWGIRGLILCPCFGEPVFSLVSVELGAFGCW